MDKMKQRAIAMASLANGIDWELFKTQKGWLVNQEGDEALGLLHFIDAVQDILTDDFQMDKYQIFELMDDEGKIIKPRVNQSHIAKGLAESIEMAEIVKAPVCIPVEEAKNILTLINLNNQ